MDAAKEWLDKPAYEKGESLGRATTAIASEVAIDVLTEGIGSVATLRKVEKVAEAADHVRDAEKVIDRAVRVGSAAEHEATGFLGQKGFELSNLQRVRNATTTIGERSYSRHALDQMQNRGIMPSVVENTIQHGTPFVGKTADTVGYFDSVNKVRVILNAETGTIITVIRGGL